MPINSLTTSKTTLFPFSGSATICAVYGVAETTGTDNVDIYVNGETTASITIPAGSPMIPIKRAGVLISKVEASAHTSTASADHGVLAG